MTKRNAELAIAKVAGYHQDSQRYVRLLVERRTTSQAAFLGAWREGWKDKQAGMPCSCGGCNQ
jgi:hypothetical protein